ncbi:MAG: type II CRISPR RNA-guided endonuclease Cas9 [Cyanobacteria bacterium CYA]|nr:MAG: type II CRISPR RNA-guided endonuclease Cas9 [Cyanobacteria bacterium CYA]
MESVKHSSGNPVPAPLVLGLDIGVASVGWAVVRLPTGDSSGSVLALGSHLFEPGTAGTDADRQRGADEPRNTARRTARLTRRQIWRRARRKRKLLLLLQEHDLLPRSTPALRTPAEIDQYLKSVDAALRPKWAKTHEDQQRWPYLIRAAAATEPVERHELGRAIYHLAQRRGFLSNRRADAGRRDEDQSEMKREIGELADRIAAHDPPTLGALLGSLDPDQERLRARWTSRAMYVDEFNAIWLRQAADHGLSEEAREEVFEAVFWQRPLKSQKNLVGRCSLEPGERRAPLAHRRAQRFRVLQAVNNLTVAAEGELPRPLTDEERATLLDALCRKGDHTWAAARRACGLGRAAHFNLEDGGDPKLIGHRTDAKLIDVFGPAFDRLSEDDRDRVVEDLRSFRLPEALERRGRSRWGLSNEQAIAFAGIELEEAYASLSLKAMRRLLPAMERGVPYATARRELYPESFASSEPHDLLPPVAASMPELRNPAVARALTEVRKVVNEVVRRYGTPDQVRIELARDVKNPRSLRERLSRQNRERQRERDDAKARILKEMGYQNPSRDDVDRVLLADECGWRCPYTDRQIEWSTLLGPQSQFDVEHIWPRSRSLDDSFVNKTLCYHEENRARKRGRTPFEAYSGDREAWNAMLARVARFKGDLRTRREKMRRFMAESIDADFTNRHLSDARYIGSAAADYLGALYGGQVDANGIRRVYIRTGGLTAWLRTGWGLADLLGSNEDGSKSRDDHRHHAIDALVVALTDERSVQQLARAAEAADARWARRAFDTVDEPWPGFLREVGEKIQSVVVSHRQSRRVSGPLHNETIYSQPINGRHRVSKELQSLTPAEIRDGRVVDKRALRAIVDKLASAGLDSPTPQQLSKFFADPASAPMVRGHGGKPVRLRRVRVEVGGQKAAIGREAAVRHVETASNHHTVVWGVCGADGSEERWEDQPVTLMEAYGRVAEGKPVVCRDGGPNRRFQFSLVIGEHVEIDVPGGEGERDIYRVLSISHRDMELARTSDARTSTQRKEAKDRLRVSGEKLRTLHARKVRVTHLGELRPARD